MRYDRQGDQHYDVTSAFIKSVRGSDVDAALHYLARMMEAGEDPRFIARRLIILASEDVGLADPTALTTAVAAAQAVQLIGMPEGRLTLAQATIALAAAPKSNAVTTAIGAASADVRAGKVGPVPAHLRDAHYSGAKDLGHGASYVYSHDAPYGVAQQQYAPTSSPTPSTTARPRSAPRPRSRTAGSACAGWSAATSRVGATSRRTTAESARAPAHGRDLLPARRAPRRPVGRAGAPGRRSDRRVGCVVMEAGTRELVLVGAFAALALLLATAALVVAARARAAARREVAAARAETAALTARLDALALSTAPPPHRRTPRPPARRPSSPVPPAPTSADPRRRRSTVRSRWPPRSRRRSSPTWSCGSP